MDGSSDSPDAALFVGVDNLNAAGWAANGGALRNFDRWIFATFLWCAKLGSGVAIYNLRNNRNLTADEVTRLAEEELATWEALKGLTRVDAPVHWRACCRVIPHLDWGRLRAQRPPIVLTYAITTFPTGKVAGRNVSFFTSTGFLG